MSEKVCPTCNQIVEMPRCQPPAGVPPSTWPGIISDVPSPSQSKFTIQLPRNE